MQARTAALGASIAVTAFVAWSGCDSPDLDFKSPRYCMDIGTSVEAPNLWTQIATGNAPAARAYASAILDEANDRLVLFGGRGENDNVYGDLWVLANATDIGSAAAWTKLSPTGTAPEAREGHVAAYDVKNNRMILHGGQDKTRGFLEVWILANANGLGGDPAWSKLATTNDPPYRVFAWSAYEEKTNALFVYGGFEGQTIKDELWMLSNANGLGTDPSTWTKIDLASRPSARANPAFAADSAGDRVFAVGGSSSTDQQAKRYDDTWTLAPLSASARAFSQLSPASPPVGRSEASLVFDPRTKRATLFGGYTGDSLTAATYVLLTDGTPTWAAFDTGNPPQERSRHVAAYSSKTNRMVIFGGEEYAGKRLGDTWVLDHANGEGSPVKEIAVKATDSICATNLATLGAECHDAASAITSCLIVWSCSDPDVLVYSNGGVRSNTPKKVTCTACLVDKSVCSPPHEIEITDPPEQASSSSGGSSSGGSSSGSSGATCPGGFLASERTCTPIEGNTCTCNDFPCSACISSSDFPLANGRALKKGEEGCIDTDGSLTGSVGKVVRPCEPGSCCLVGGQCGGAGSRCGDCLNVCN